MKNSTSIILSSMSTVALTILLLSNQPSSTLALTNHHVNVNVNTSPSRGGMLGSAAPPQYSHYLPSHTNRNRNRKSNLSMASSSNDSSSTTTQSSVSPQALEPLAKEGPWQAFLDESTTGLIYYFNSNTGESMWDPPTKTFPKIRMTRKEKRRMMSIRKEYAEVQRLEMEERELEILEKTKREKIGGFFGGLWNNNKKKEVVDEDDASTVPLNANEALNGNVGTNGGSNVEQQQVQEEVQPQQPAFTVPDLGGLMANFAPSEQSTSSPTATTTEPEQVSNEPEPEYYYEEEEEEYFEAPVVAKPLRVEVASRVLPHPEKISWGGEDALFSQGRTFGVFDGVSGAEKEAGIPLYSVTLSRQLKATVGKKGLTTDEMQAKLLAAAELADDAATGASTAIVASMGEDGFLRVLNVGDSTLLVIRNGIVASKSKEIVHYFDCPYQLSSDSPDRPKDGTIMNVEIVPGDVIVTGSDGIFDNLSDEAICEIVSSKKGSTMSLAKRITDESRKISLDTEAATPYAKLAKRNRYPEYKSGLGGKVDDISCVVVRCT